MQPQRQVIPIKAAFVSDRGLSQKRPLNEDSYLCDQIRCLFIVADGVGGAQAGEVASQTAVEVLDEAFRHQLNANDDVEDLLEIAIQRANNSIYQMAREHPKFSAMATTLVVLHVDGLTATIGHVGDSRLYRLAPDGRLYQETQDHSVVEEEVRAGRMTREQAANHPSRNVISRALGAEANVDVDMKSIRFEDGTTFLLCSDGITRHVSDTEIRTLLGSRRRSLEKICEEMKNLCYERGAEDNLTAVVIRVGGLDQPEDDERTIPTPRPIRSDADDYRISQVRPPVATEPRLRAPSADLPAPLSRELETPKKSGGFFKKLLLTVLFLGGIAGAFFGGMALREKFVSLTGLHVPTLAPPVAATPTPAATPDTFANQGRATFLSARAEVDRAPADWLAQPANAAPSTTEGLYLQGRALFLLNRDKEAIAAFEKALAQMTAERPETSPLKMETQAARLRAKAAKLITVEELRNSLDDMIGVGEPAAKPSPGASPEASPQPAGTPSARPPTPPASGYQSVR